MYFATNLDLFDPPSERVVSLEPWKPHALDHASWPPDYAAVYAWRIRTLSQLRANPAALASAKAYYSDKPGEFIQHWMDTYNPRKDKIKWMPFVFFMKQEHFIEYLEGLRADQENGLVEKCRDIGATWLVCGYSVWCWLFLDDFAFGWGSRKQELVDKLGDPDSIFEKMRLLIKRLPDIWLPQGFSTRNHATFMKLINPANGSTITGESGDSIGRGGRKSFYGKDESAHYERPEKIEAALGDNTNVQLDISSVNGLGNVFHRRRKAGLDWAPGVVIPPGYTRVFVFDWRDHPEKTQEWYDQRKAKAEREGMQHVFAQEVDRNYSAAILNTVISAHWLDHCVDAHLKIPYLRIPPPNTWMAGLDIADGGMDRNAQALRQWIILRSVQEWGDRDPGETTRRSIQMIRDDKRVPRGTAVQYDSVSIGSGVKSEYNRLIESGDLKHGEIPYVAWNAGGAVVNPYDHIIHDDEESMLNRDFYENFKAQAWWSLRARVYKTFKVMSWLNDPNRQGTIPMYSPDELISFDSEGLGANLYPLLQELAQAVSKPSKALKTMIDKTPEGTKSPNMGDATVMAFFPVPDDGGYALIGGYSG